MGQIIPDCGSEETSSGDTFENASYSTSRTGSDSATSSGNANNPRPCYYIIDKEDFLFDDDMEEEEEEWDTDSVRMGLHVDTDFFVRWVREKSTSLREALYASRTKDTSTGTGSNTTTSTTSSPDDYYHNMMYDIDTDLTLPLILPHHL